MVSFRVVLGCSLHAGESGCSAAVLIAHLGGTYAAMEPFKDEAFLAAIVFDDVQSRGSIGVFDWEDESRWLVRPK